MNDETIKIKRECGDCTKCCEWLVGEAHGHKFHPGKKCFFLGKNCGIYEKRPDVCKEYECEWLRNENFPNWMKPNLSNVIISQKVCNDILYYDVIEAGKTIGVDALNWIIQQALNLKLNLLYRVDGALFKVGSDDFIKMDLSKNIVFADISTNLSNK